MDDENISDLNGRAPRGSSAKILLLGSFDPEGERIIRDPYYVISTLNALFISTLSITYYRMMALLVLRNVTSNASDVVLPFYRK